MKYALIDDTGAIRGLFDSDQGGRLFQINGEQPRGLVPLTDNDPRVLALLNPPEPVKEALVTRAEYDALKAELESLKQKAGIV